MSSWNSDIVPATRLAMGWAAHAATSTARQAEASGCTALRDCVSPRDRRGLRFVSGDQFFRRKQAHVACQQQGFRRTYGHWATGAPVFKANKGHHSASCQICINLQVDDKYDFTCQFIRWKYNC
jgi:hypothetical protein